MQRDSFYAPLLVLIAVILLGVWAFRFDPHGYDSQAIPRPMPAFELETVDGKTLGLAQVKGKVVLLHVWASWCQICAAEWSDLRDYSRAVTLVGLPYHDRRVTVTRWLAQNGNPFAHVLLDPNNDLAFELGVTGSPESFLIDKKGVIRAQWLGALSQNWQTEVLPAIIRLSEEE